MQQPDKTGKKQGGKTKFKPGQSGNPQGRKIGSRNRVSVMVDQLLEGEAQAIAETAILKAKEGDSTMLKALLDRVCPPRKERPITLDLPSLVDATTIPDATRAIIEAAARGDLEPGQAATMIQAISGHIKAVEMGEMERRLSRLEEQTGD